MDLRTVEEAGYTKSDVLKDDARLVRAALANGQLGVVMYLVRSFRLFGFTDSHARAAENMLEVFGPSPPRGEDKGIPLMGWYAECAMSVLDNASRRAIDNPEAIHGIFVGDLCLQDEQEIAYAILSYITAAKIEDVSLVLECIRRGYIDTESVLHYLNESDFLVSEFLERCEVCEDSSGYDETVACLHEDYTEDIERVFPWTRYWSVKKVMERENELHLKSKVLQEEASTESVMRARGVW